ncbi:hypothetical protein [Klebsiella aerogenes]|uniref:hypothetical protein n=1 Tax=Klebsiella aerogenes TaxID=548 RepID=UPI0031E1A2A6
MMEIIQGTCSCGEPISIELSAKMSCRTDGKRPFYPDENKGPEVIGNFVYSQDGVTVFRCRRCSGWIADTVPEAALEVRDA